MNSKDAAAGVFWIGALIGSIGIGGAFGVWWGVFVFGLMLMFVGWMGVYAALNAED